MAITHSTAAKREGSPSRSKPGLPSEKTVMNDLNTESSLAEAIRGKTATSAGPSDKDTQLKDVSRSLVGPKSSCGFSNRILQSRMPGTGMILDLPTEVQEKTAELLPLHAFGNFRLACREIDRRTLRAFGNKFFKEKNFLPSLYGLQALLAISQSRVARYMRAVGLGPPSQDQRPPVINDQCLSSADKIQMSASLQKYAEDNHLMRILGRDAAMIRAALRNIPSITTLTFLDAENLLYCPSFGAGYFEELISVRGYPWYVDLDALQSMSRLFVITLHAAEAAGLRLNASTPQKPSGDGGT